MNGLDPDGVLWIRNLLKNLAAEGRTVFVSSHLMSEMALTAQHLIVIGRGRLIADVSISEFTAQASTSTVRVVSPRAPELRSVLAGDGVTVASSEPGSLTVTGLTAAEIGDRALAARIAVHELAPQHASLEEAFMEMTRDAVEYHATSGRPLAFAGEETR